MKKLNLLLLMMAILFALSTVNAQQWGLYTLYATKDGTQGYLIDTASVNYKTWTFSSSKKSGYSAYLVPGDTLVRTYKYTGNVINGGGVTGGVQKVDWSGNVVWDYVYSSSTYVIHHDICPLPNGNVLMISYDVKTSADAIQAGSSSSSTFYSEKIIEVHPTGATTGTIVWEWKLWDHLCQNYNSSKDNYVTSIINNPQLLNINYTGTGMLPDRWHMNGLDYNADLDQIVLSIHFMNEAYIIDHSTTAVEAAGHNGGNSGKGGDFLYRWGNPASYGATGTTIFNVIHDAHWIPSDNPNYPDYLCGFNNNPPSNSKVDIWNPPYDGYNYLLTLGSAYAPSTYDYQFTATFAASNEGNSQQLPNGNMIVNNSFGSIYEVNAAGTNLWTKSNANSSHAYRYSKCYVRGPIATAGASSTSVSPGTPITLSSSASSVTETSPSYTYSWSSDPSGFSSSLQNPADSPYTTTTYTVTVTNTALGCSNTASVTVDVVTGMIDETTKNDITLFPNPTTGILNIAGSVVENQNFEICIYNTYGKLILKKKNTIIIDLFDFDNGMYFLQIISENNIVNNKVLLMK
ncbi:MAG: aryl-sulfate sulfotransferase [Bacteroidota bacterium]